MKTTAILFTALASVVFAADNNTTTEENNASQASDDYAQYYAQFGSAPSNSSNEQYDGPFFPGYSNEDYYYAGFPGYSPYDEYYQKRDANAEAHPEAWSPYTPPGHSSPGHYGGNWMLNPWNAW